MDQKRAMLYPPIEGASSEMARDQRMSTIGLPTEAPPSYDMAVASTSSPTGPSTPGWQASAPEIVVQAHQPQPQQQPALPQQSDQYSGRHQRRHHKHGAHARSVIVEQPQPQTTVPYPHQQPQQDQLPTVNSPLPPKLGPNPCAVTCPACGTNKTTRMYYTPNTRTHLSALILCLVGWCCCACLVPYCMNSCRTGNHYCSQCNTFLGAYNPRRHK